MLNWRLIGVTCGAYLLMAIVVIGILVFSISNYYEEDGCDDRYLPIIYSLEKEICDLNNDVHYGGFVLSTDKVYSVVCEDKTIRLKYGGK